MPGAPERGWWAGTLDFFRSLPEWSAKVTLASSISFAAAGVAVLLSGWLKLRADVAFVGGFSLGLPFTALIQSSTAVVEFRLKRARRLLQIGALTEKEYEAFRKQITLRYRKG